MSRVLQVRPRPRALRAHRPAFVRVRRRHGEHRRKRQAHPDRAAGHTLPPVSRRRAFLPRRSGHGQVSGIGGTGAAAGMTNASMDFGNGPTALVRMRSGHACMGYTQFLPGTARSSPIRFRMICCIPIRTHSIGDGLLSMSGPVRPNERLKATLRTLSASLVSAPLLASGCAAPPDLLTRHQVSALRQNELTACAQDAARLTVTQPTTVYCDVEMGTGPGRVLVAPGHRARVMGPEEYAPRLRAAPAMPLPLNDPASMDLPDPRASNATRTIWKQPAGP